MFLPKKWIPAAITFIILLAPAYRFWAYQIHRLEISPFDFKAGTFTLASIDSLGLGALLACVWRSKLAIATTQKYLTTLILPFGLFLYIASLALYHYHIKPSVFFTLNDFAASLIFTWLVSAAGLGFKGLMGKFMVFPTFVYLGKISYGIYIYHYFMPTLLAPVFEILKIQYQVPGLMNFIISSLLSVTLASLSWRMLEMPISGLKRQFQYRQRSGNKVPVLASGQTAMEK